MVGDQEKPPSLSPSSHLSPDARICTQCYWIGQPRIEKYGTWPSFLFRLIFITPFLFIGKLLHACLPYLPLAKYIFKEDLEEEWAIFPDSPYTLYGCGHCTHPNSMVLISTRPGEDALYWAKKKEKEYL